MYKKDYIIRFYAEINSGKEPVKKLMDSLEKPEIKILSNSIGLLKKIWPVGMPFVRCMKEGLYELRVQLINRQARIFFLVDNEHIVLLHGFIKKTQTTPPKELRLAYKRLQVYKFNTKDHYEEEK